MPKASIMGDILPRVPHMFGKPKNHAPLENRLDSGVLAQCRSSLICSARRNARTIIVVSEAQFGTRFVSATYDDIPGQSKNTFAAASC